MFTLTFKQAPRVDQTNLELGAILLHQEVKLEVMEVIQEGLVVIVHKEQRLIDKLLENVLNLLQLQVPQNRQHLEEGVTLYHVYLQRHTNSKFAHILKQIIMSSPIKCAKSYILHNNHM